jgi:hypothetical protein
MDCRHRVAMNHLMSIKFDAVYTDGFDVAFKI